MSGSSYEGKRLIIANRGEIACRVIRSARRLGFTTIAVYSTSDRHAPHVALADESILLGEPPPADSYLNIDRILDAAVESGADALHPGYGFLAENPDFANALMDRGIRFIGPSPKAIQLMGLKGVARQRMQDAGIPVLPGTNEVSTDVDEMLRQANEVGFPLLVKPEAGGGGKGMKIVRSEKELTNACEGARREAKNAFGDDRLLFEKYLEGPRHIEVQVFADESGNCVFLNERDCSLQRRHQKIVEEAPAPGVSAELRTAMGETAVKAATSIGYLGAGTVEFLLDRNDDFYFMEMNTRLQVEHPVTEMVTGLDLVEWQLRVAFGEALPLRQDEVKLTGHAIEARIYAEDPLNDFLPVSGRITRLKLPGESDSVRIDNGVAEGEQVGVYYDPMMMKLIAHGEDRTSALAHLREALVELGIAGIRTNRDFICHVLDNDRFRQGGIGTNYLDEHLPEIFQEPGEEKFRANVCAAALAMITGGDASPWSSLSGFRLNSPHRSTILLEHAGTEYKVTLEFGSGNSVVQFDGSSHRCTSIRDADRMELICDGTPYSFEILEYGDHLTLVSHSRTLDFGIPMEQAGQADEEGSVTAPLAGKIAAILVSDGDSIEKGTPLAIIEAMKMEHTISAPSDGIVKCVHFNAGDLIDEGVEILEIEAEEDS